ncbi:putative GTP-binding protein [Leptomonas pyrrhocoris]|uniref:Putative GTP-binding protein n=1 Tax=Leptomonas pyrrhocoris TaxID=157538 RepID=A0A0M9G2U4_LEPPY|nr:putative GTP-binding protein [Leptomonas pyrrhocoris]KPA81270.1 putative GTP-binding protein [Leptomonas pyrrhocoris]|eukprot:XP_015659709.1 putative GTP-binding protein [Leptomonas pyrrhocoris]
MLRCTRCTWRAKHRFVDRVKVLICSGAGGDGASIMAHVHGNELAGPGGGNGGNGGNVMLRCVKSCTDLSEIEGMGSQISAGTGCCGFSREAHGKRGQDLWLQLPVGTQVIDMDTNEVQYDLDEAGVEMILLEGGQGGKGNAAFANKYHHSPIESTKGLPGNTMLAQIELKTIADCGLVGYPNAGKSSLLSAISASKPTIAPYAFTTLRPYVGVLHDLYGNVCRVADIPGLIEGAYENRGLGHQFLRHVERTKCLALVVDMCDTYIPTNSTQAVLQPWDVVDLLLQELDYYLAGMSERVIMIFANKMDVEKDSSGSPTRQKLEELQRRVSLPVFPISAALGIELGPQHASTGLAPALQFMCNEVFSRQSQERQVRQFRYSQEREQLERAFRAKNNGVFLPSIPSMESFDAASLSPSAGSEGGGGEDGSVASLVDQQFDFIGNSGLGVDFDAYANSAARGQLHRYRDLTMKGKYWNLTREDGEVLKGERWK